MERIADGFTILEVLIVLAVSSVLFFAAFIAINGQTGQTNFSEAMQDLNSKIQNYVSQVSAGSYPGSSFYSCSLVGNPPMAQLSASSPGTNSQCIYLGRAILALPGSSTLTAYAVLADRDQYTLDGQDTGNISESIDTASPVPAILYSNGTYSYALTDSYQIGAGSTIVYSYIANSAEPPTTPYDLIGIYNGLPEDSSGATVNSTASVLKGYPCTAVTCPANSTPTAPTSNGSGVEGCIEEANVNASLDCSDADGNDYSPTTTQWNLCIQDGGSTDRALLSVNANPEGITTQLKFAGC